MERRTDPWAEFLRRFIVSAGLAGAAAVPPANAAAADPARQPPAETGEREPAAAADAEA